MNRNRELEVINEEDVSMISKDIQPEEDKSQGVLHYGALVYLTFSEDNSEDYYAFSEGFNDTSVMLKAKAQFVAHGSHYNGLFRIYPSFYHNEYIKGKNKFERYQEDIEGYRFEKRDTRAEIPKMIKSIDEEEILNYDVYEKLKGTPIRFGQVIQLLHVSSQKYLTYVPEKMSEFESECMKVDLSYETSEFSCFRIQPCYKFQQEMQEFIYDKEAVNLVSVMENPYSVSAEPYLHASRTLKESQGKETWHDQKEINVSLDRKSLWRLRIFADYFNEKQGLLSVGDVIWINLSEEDKNLVVLNSGDREGGAIFKFVSCNPSEKYKKFVGSSNGMFIIENLNMDTGGLVRWHNDYILKHVTTNQYLAVGPSPNWDIDEKRDHKTYSLQLVNRANDAAKLKFDVVHSTISSKEKDLLLKYVQKDSYFTLKLDQKGMNIKNDNSLVYKDVMKDHIEGRDNRDLESDYLTVPLVSRAQGDNIFHLSRANHSEVLVTLFLLSCKNTIKEVVEHVNPEKIEVENQTLSQLQLVYKKAIDKMSTMKQCLLQLDDFCRNKLLSYLNSDQVYGEINSFVQNVLKEQLFIEMLVQIIITSFPTYDHLKELLATETQRSARKARKETKLASDPNLDHSAQSIEDKFSSHVMNEIKEELNHKKMKICSLVYRLLSSICEKNHANQVYTFKYLPILQIHSDFIPGAIDCINYVLGWNEELLLNLHKREGVRFSAEKGVVLTEQEKTKSEKNTAREEEIALKLDIKTQDDQEAIYRKFYNQVRDLLDADVTGLWDYWNFIQFFVIRLPQTRDPIKRKKIIKFLKNIAESDHTAINVNQEQIYTLLIENSQHSDPLIANFSLKITSDAAHLMVTMSNGDDMPVQKPLVEYISETDDQHNLTSEDSLEQSTLLDLSYNPERHFSSLLDGSNKFELLYDYIDFFSIMCKGRNHIWKQNLDKIFKPTAFLRTIDDERIPPNIRAVLARLMSNLYLDQEPRRKKQYPVLCKIVDANKTTNLLQNASLIATEKDNENSGEGDTAQIERLKTKIINHVSNAEKIVLGLPLSFQKESHLRSLPDWSKVYNVYTYELLLLVNMLLEFQSIRIIAQGGYQRKSTKTGFGLNLLKLGQKSDNNSSSKSKKKKEAEKKKKEAERKKKKKAEEVERSRSRLDSEISAISADKQQLEFSNVLKSLITMLEYDRTYPEARQQLLNIKKQREDTKKGSFTKVLKGFGGMLSKTKDMFFNFEFSSREMKKKSTKGRNFFESLNEEITGNENYLKQSEVMKRVLESMLSKQNNPIENEIKLQIIQIIQYFFDFKHDQYLKNYRDTFLEIVKTNNIFEKVKRKEIADEALGDLMLQLIDSNAEKFLPSLMRTGTDVDDNDEELKSTLDFEDPLDLNDILGFEVLPMLFQLFCLTNEKRLEEGLLAVMLQMYSQRHEFLDLTKELLLIFEDEHINLYRKARKKTQMFQKLVEESENWLTSKQLGVDELIECKRLLTYFYNQLFKNSKNDDPESDVVDPKKVYTKDIDPIRQQIYSQLKIHTHTVSLLRDNFHMIVEKNHQQEIVDLFRTCFSLLTAFVKGNKTNQQLLSKSIVVFKYNMSYQLGQVELINEIFRDNHSLCTNVAEFNVIQDFVKVIMNNGRKADYLEFFMIIQKAEDNWIYTNQKLVLDTLLEPKLKSRLLYMCDVQGTNHLEFAFDDKYKELPNDEPFLYHHKIIDVCYFLARLSNLTLYITKILSLAGFGKEGMIQNEIRLRKTIVLPYIIELLSMPDDFTRDDESLADKMDLPSQGYERLKIPLHKFIYYIYLESEKINLEHSTTEANMFRYIQLETKRLKTLKSYKNSFVEYLIDNLFYTIYLYQKSLRASTNLEDRKESHEKKNYNTMVEFITATVEFIQNFHPKNISAEGVKNVKNLANSLEYKQYNLDVNFFWAWLDSNNNAKELFSYLKHESVELKHQEIELEVSTSDQNIYKKIWVQFQEKFHESETIKQEIQKEKKILALALNKVDALFGKVKSIRDIVNNEEIIKKLINYVLFETQSKYYSKATATILEVLGHMINMEVKDENIEADQLKEQVQNFLNKNNATFMFLYRLSDPQFSFSDKLFGYFIDFAINLLDGGNNEVQKNVYKYFANFPNSEVFFFKIHERINSDIFSLKSLVEDPEMELIGFEIDEMARILRLLQLFAEGHYNELQNYVRQQHNNYHSYDILSDIINLLSIYMQTKDSRFFESMMQCFDTITEYIQGPCYENQVSIIQGSFLDIASSLFSQDDVLEQERAKLKKEDANSKQDERKLKPWQLARLKYKCSITLISLLESRKNDDVVYRMLKSMQVDIVKRNLTDIYYSFKEIYNENYNDDVFLHFNYEPQPGDKKLTEAYCSTIIETGFNLFILLSNFLECKLTSSEDDEEIQENLKDLKDTNIITNNVVGKLAKFGLSFVKTTLQTAGDIAKKGKSLVDKGLLNRGGRQEELSHENAIIAELQERRLRVWKDAFGFFRKNIAHIEVLREDGNLEKTYFYIPPFCHAVTKDTKTLFNNNVNRISVKSKVHDLQSKADDLIETIKQEYNLNRLFNRIKLISIIASQILLWRDIAFLIAIVINLIVLFSYERVEVNGESEIQRSNESVINALGIVLIVLTMIIVASFILKTAPIIIKKAWKGVTKDKLNLLKYVLRIINTVFLVVSDFYVVYYLVYGATAIIGLAVSPFFFAFHLFDVLVRFPTLLNVVKSVWIPRKSILLTLMLFIMLQYAFMLFAYYWLADDFYNDLCSSTWICMLTFIDKSFKADGSIGGYITPYQNEVNLLRFFYDNIYNFALMIILLNIVVGIIIDTFGQLRDEEKEFNRDITNICFICGHDRETIDKASGVETGFQSHIKNEHYLWHYLFYIAYLKGKDKTEFTGIESYVYEKIEKRDTSWFPTHRALILKGQTEEEESTYLLDAFKKLEDEQSELIKYSQSAIKGMVSSLGNLESSLKKHVAGKRVKSLLKKATNVSKTSEPVSDPNV